jgi:hypothetical protein
MTNETNETNGAENGGGAAKSKVAKRIVEARVSFNWSRHWIMPMLKKSGNPYVTATSRLSFV